MASCLPFAGLRLNNNRAAAVPRPVASARAVAHLAPRRIALLPSAHLSRRRAPLCAAARADKEEVEDTESGVSKNKKEPTVLPAKLPAGARKEG